MIKSLVVLFSLIFSFPASALMSSEKNTIAVFQAASPKVVYVHRMKTVTNRYAQRLEIPAGTGSGIVWDRKGHVVTNYHVIKGADHFLVTVGKMTVLARVIGAEPRKDIAVLAIKSPKALAWLSSFKPFALAPSSTLLVGQKALAIGNPFGLDHTLTVGVVSALGRQVPGIGGMKIRDMIQTDASINPGNSGGPLLDSDGRLMGMNSMIFSQSGTSAGIGFAVPAEDIARIVDQIITHGRVVLAGIGILPVDPGIAARLGVKKGVLIAKVLPNTPAAWAGLRGVTHDGWGRTVLGDQLVAMNGKKLRNYETLYHRLSKMTVGDTVGVTVLRAGQIKQYVLKTIDIAGY